MSEPVSIEEQIGWVAIAKGYYMPDWSSKDADAILATLRAHQKALAVVREQQAQGVTGGSLGRLQRAITGDEE